MLVVTTFILIICIGLAVHLLRVRGQLAKAVKSGKMHTAYLGNMSHQMRTALHSVTGLAEIIAKDDVYLSKSEKKSISEQIKFNTNLITTMLDELSALSDDNYGHEVQLESFGPNALCLRCLEACRAAHEKQTVRLNFKRMVPDSYLVWSDPHIVELLLNKLLLNACRFTERGEITVGCYAMSAESKFIFFVQDTGNGIPKDRKSFLFTWFESPEKMVDPVELDLSVAQRLAERLGGFLLLDELYTNGTRLILTIPLSQR